MISSCPYFVKNRFVRWTRLWFGFIFILVLAHGNAGFSPVFGLDFSLPRTPLAGRGDYRFVLWEEWGRIKPDPNAGLEIPVNVGWTPIPEWQHSPVLGEGWCLSLFESTLVLENETTYIWRQPFGHTKRLTKERKNPNLFTGAGWTAEIRGMVATLKLPGGRWQLTYKAGRLAQLKSKTLTLDFTYEKNGTRQLMANGKVVATLKREFDAATTRPFWRLSFLTENGWRNATLVLGTRTVWVHEEKKPDQRRNAATLVSLKFDNEPERQYDFTANTLNLSGHLYKWDVKRNFLEQDGNEKHSSLEIEGIKCHRREYPDGSSEIRGQSREHDILIVQGRNKPMMLLEYVPKFNAEIFLSKARRIFKINQAGKKELVLQHWYDASGRIVRSFSRNKNGEGHYFVEKENVIKALSEDKKTVIWEKTFDTSGRLVKFKNSKNEISLDYLPGENVRIIFRAQHGEEKTSVLPLKNIQMILSSQTD